MLFPAPDSPAETDFARAVEVSRFFGGTPRLAGDAAAGGPAMALPTPKSKLDLPPPAAAPAKKKRKEGC